MSGERITFHGAARTVTGSRHLIEYDGQRILVDCGLFQGTRELKEMNWDKIPFDPASLDMVIVTHAHTDHIGLLPRLCKLGYKGPILSTHGTLGISKISLPDGGRLQEEDARFHNKHRTSRHDPAEPLYTEQDAYNCLRQFRAHRYHEIVALPGGASFRFQPAGHILGSAFVELFFPNGERILMSGDLGRKDTPIIIDPTPMDFAEHLVLESTYGDRLHGDENASAKLEAILNESFRDGKCVIVPSFAIGRTQELLYLIDLLQKQGRVPRVPIFIDSPMATSATQLYSITGEDHDEDMKLARTEDDDPLRPEHCEFVRDRNQSKALNSRKGPMMIIAGSGMANGGRVVHHLKQRLPDPSTIVLFTGYQAEGTMGRAMMEGAETVEIHRTEIPVRARVEQMTSLSAHADYSEILDWLGNFKQAPRKTFLVHGEIGPQESLRQKIVERFGWEVEIPTLGQTFAL